MFVNHLAAKRIYISYNYDVIAFLDDDISTFYISETFNITVICEYMYVST